MQQRGFSLIEILIVIAIIGVLVAVALPSYQNYTRRAHFTEVVQAAAPYKIGVTECYQLTGSLVDCNNGQNGVPGAISSGTSKSLVGSLQVNQGVITIAPQAKYGITAEQTYILTPTASEHGLSWTTSGGAVTAGLAN